MKILVLNGSPKKENSDTLHITRAEYEQCIRDDIRKNVELSAKIVEEKGFWNNAALDIVLVGGSTYLPLVRNAGSVFMGCCCPESLGDYLAGPNHTLPTSGTARFSSPLSVDDFVKKTQYTYFTREALAQVADEIAVFARAEGLEAHARAALVRMDDGEA